jgi:anti-anti-sigma regulatory factor
MPFTVQPSGDVIVVKVHTKRLDAYLAPEFKAKLVHLVQSGHERIVMDMAALEFIDKYPTKSFGSRWIPGS